MTEARHDAPPSTASAAELFLLGKHLLGETLRDGASWMRIAGRRVGLGKHRAANGGRPSLLIFDERLPDPTFGAGFPRAAGMLRVILDAGWQVTFYPMMARPDAYAPVRQCFPNVRFLRSSDERGMRRVMRESVGMFDAVLVSRPTTMRTFVRIADKLPAFTRQSYCIYDAEAVVAMRDVLQARVFGRPSSQDQHAAACDAEVKLARNMRAIVCVTEADARVFRERTDVPVNVVSHSMSPNFHSPAFGARADLLFVGRMTGDRYESPNVDSLIWFVEQVMPLLDARLGTDYRLVIAGIADRVLVDRLSSPRVVFLGIVDDLENWYDRSRVFIAPTRFAGGLPLKVIEAAGAGIPCVVTEILAEQLGQHGDIECLSAASEATFAEKCAALYSDEKLWTRVRDAALRRVSVDYASSAFTNAIRQVLDASIALAVRS